MTSENTDATDDTGRAGDEAAPPPSPPYAAWRCGPRTTAPPNRPTTRKDPMSDELPDPAVRHRAVKDALRQAAGQLQAHRARVDHNGHVLPPPADPAPAVEPSEPTEPPVPPTSGAAFPGAPSLPGPTIPQQIAQAQAAGDWRAALRLINHHHLEPLGLAVAEGTTR